MSSDTESRLDELFAQLPEPEGEVTEHALARALDALAPSASRHRPARAAAFALAAAVALLGVSAGALAAAGALHVSFGQSPHPPQKRSVPSVSQLAVPRGARGIAATIDGRLWLSTASGLRLQGLPVTAAALSPRAQYVAAGIGRALVAMAPDGHRAWSDPTPGSVVAISWAPDGLRIAYIIRTGKRLRLYVVEGNGSHDRLLDPAVRTTAPSWRNDSLALAYVAAGGRPVIYDLAHNTHTIVSTPAARYATFLAFSPNSHDDLAVATTHAVRIAGRISARPATFPRETVAGIGWIDGKLAVAMNPRTPGAATVRIYRVTRNDSLVEAGRRTAPVHIEALDAWNTRLTLAVASGSGVHILTVTAANSRDKILLQLPPASRVAALATR